MDESYKTRHIFYVKGLKFSEDIRNYFSENSLLLSNGNINDKMIQFPQKYFWKVLLDIKLLMTNEDKFFSIHLSLRILLKQYLIKHSESA
jgi:hypothetical protein